MSFGSVLKVVVKDVFVKAPEAVIHEIEAFPSQAEHVLADLFKWTAKQFGPEAVQAAVALAETYIGQILPKAQGLAEGQIATLVTDAEHTVAFNWLKGELMATGVVTSLPDAHTLAGLAWTWVLKGLSVVEQSVVKAEGDAGITPPAAPTQS